jgi:hypothetical protein
MEPDRPPLSARGLVVAAWAIGAIALSLVEAIWRLGARASATLRAGLEPLEWAALIFVVALFLYGEGVRALQRRFVPHVVTRTVAVARSGGAASALLAPLYAMSLVHDAPRAVARAWAGVALIVLAVVAVRELPEPWRGVIDAGVASALSWGLGALLLQSGRALR